MGPVWVQARSRLQLGVMTSTHTVLKAAYFNSYPHPNPEPNPEPDPEPDPNLNSYPNLDRRHGKRRETTSNESEISFTSETLELYFFRKETYIFQIEYAVS